MSEPLPEKSVSTAEVTFEAPHILKSATTGEARQSFTISNGGRMQVNMTTETWLSETPVDPPEILKILATNRILIGGQPVDVLNDAMEYNGKSLAPSSPTASQYGSMIGKQVFFSPSKSTPAFSCTPLQPDNPNLKFYDKPALYFVKRVSIILL